MNDARTGGQAARGEEPAAVAHVALRGGEGVIGPRNIAGAFLAMEGAAISVRQERCAKVRNRNVTCLKCAEACTSGCISLVDDELVIDAAKCVGCGTCATVCPTCALEARNPTDAQLVALCDAAREGDAVSVACAQVPDEALAGEAGVARVVCLGRVEESLLVELAARGVSRVSLLCADCEACPQRTGRATADLVAQTTCLLLDAWGAHMDVDVRTVAAPQPHALPCVNAQGGNAVSQGSNDDMDFGTPDDSSTETGSSLKSLPNEAESPHRNAAFLHVMRDGTLPHFVPDRRERLLASLVQLGKPQQESLSCRLWGSVVIDATKCVSCRMCATFCPTGAIVKFDGPDDAIGVNHYPESCVKCASCCDICPEGAIILRDEVKTRYLAEGGCHHYMMNPRPVALRDNPHQILETMRLTFDGDLFER